MKEAYKKLKGISSSIKAPSLATSCPIRQRGLRKQLNYSNKLLPITNLPSDGMIPPKPILNVYNVTRHAKEVKLLISTLMQQM